MRFDGLVWLVTTVVWSFKLAHFEEIEICFQKCRCRQPTVINCHSAGVGNNSTFWKGIYKRVEYLDLSRNTIDTINSAISESTELIFLNLSSNRIQKIPSYAFSKLRKLQVLDLSKNMIKSLSAINAGTVFVSNKDLQYLNLSYNPLTDLGNTYENSYIYSSSLVSLDVNHCDVRYLNGPLCLQGMERLNVLNLAYNPLLRLDGLTSNSLISLDLSACSLQFLRADSLSELVALKELYLSRNEQLNTPFFRAVSRTVEIFVAEYCSLDSANTLDIPSARKMSLRGNRIREMVSGSFQSYADLEYLDVSENIISWVSEDAFSGAGAVKYLDLSRNLLTALEISTFSSLRNLMTLNLSRNFFSSMPYLESRSIAELDISHCEIRYLDSRNLLGLLSLKKLNLSYNFLEKLPEHLTSSSLEQLDLSSCKLMNFNLFELNRLSMLKKLDLRGNRLVYLQNTSLVTRIREIELGNNPWKCDCWDEDFKSLAKELKYNDPTELICSFPPNISGKTWYEACSESWSHVSHHQGSKDLLVLCIVAVTLIIAVVGTCSVMLIQEKICSKETSRTEIIETPRITVPAQSDTTQASQLSQLPSYDEALLLPKFSNEDVSKTRKRQSGTQTDETMASLLKALDQGHIVQYEVEGTQEIQYVNLTRPIQSTEL